MSTVTQTIQVERCPECGKPHRFSLKIRRSLVISMAGDEAEDSPSTFTCLFTCPSTGRTFQVQLRFAFSPAQRTLSVEGGAAIDEDER